MKKNSGNKKTGEDIDFEDEMDFLNLNRDRNESAEPKRGRGIWRPNR